MEVCRWKKKKSDPTSYNGLFIKVSRKEAFQIVQSFMSQILSNNPNSNRVEHFTIEGEYITLAIQPEEQEKKGYDDYYKEYLQRLYPEV